MNPSFLRYLAASIVMLSGCHKPAVPTSTGLTYICLPKVSIAASGVCVNVSPSVHETQSLQTLPLSKMVQQWASDYWQPMGGCCRVIFNIQDIQMVEEALVCKMTAKEWVQVRNSDIYKGRMTVSCQLVAPNGALLGSTNITLRHERYVPENYTFSQRKALWNQLRENLINQLTQETTTHIPDMICRINGASA